MNKKIVSVIIPAYNCAGTIRQAVDSALNQDVPTEVIVIDDASQDELAALLAPYLSAGMIRILQNKENQGVAKSRNRGVQEARGEYVAFLDGDDWWEAETLGRRLKALEKSGASLCCTAREIHRSDGASTGKYRRVKSRITYRQMLYHNSIACSSVVMRTETARKYPMEREDSHEDYIAWLKILRGEGPACGVNQPWLHYRLSPEGKSSNKWRAAGMRYQAYRHVGIGPVRSAFYFVCYAVNGILCRLL